MFKKVIISTSYLQEGCHLEMSKMQDIKQESPWSVVARDIKVLMKQLFLFENLVPFREHNEGLFIRVFPYPILSEI